MALRASGRRRLAKQWANRCSIMAWSTVRNLALTENGWSRRAVMVPRGYGKRQLANRWANRYNMIKTSGTRTLVPDGKWVVTASGDRTARVGEAVTGKPVGQPLRHDGNVTRAAFSPDAMRVVT